MEAKIRKRKAAIAQIERNIEEARETRKCTGREVKSDVYMSSRKGKNAHNLAEANKQNDPEQVEHVRRQAKKNMDHANRW